MSFRLVPKLVTLNGIMAHILCYFTEFVYLLYYVVIKSSRSLSHPMSFLLILDMFG